MIRIATHGLVSPRYARQNGGDGMMAQRKRNAALYVRVSTDYPTRSITQLMMDRSSALEGSCFGVSESEHSATLRPHIEGELFPWPAHGLARQRPYKGA